MCRTIHAVLQTLICGIQMLVRVFMTVILMVENLIRMILQTMYNFISFLLQMISLIPICLVFLLTARLKCFMCGGGGPCPAGRAGGACDCVMSAIAILILFLIFRATGVLDKIFYSIGYAKASGVTKFVPTQGEVTECSRNDTDSYYVDANSTETDEEEEVQVKKKTKSRKELQRERQRYRITKEMLKLNQKKSTKSHKKTVAKIESGSSNSSAKALRVGDNDDIDAYATEVPSNWTTILYYLI